MMNIPPSEAKRLTWWEYQALLWNWNDRHDPEGENEPAEAPDADFIRRRQERIVHAGLAKVLH